jgi:hypothetical protein
LEVSAGAVVFLAEAMRKGAVRVERTKARSGYQQK